MEKTLNKKVLLFGALIVSIICITIISLSPVLANMKNQEATLVKAPIQANTKDISGKRIIGITISENFLEEEKYDIKNKDTHTDTITQEIFINGKGYPFILDNLATEITGGIYEVNGHLDMKTNIVTLKKVTYLGEVFDGMKETTKENQALLTGHKKVKSKKVAVFLFNYRNSNEKVLFPNEVSNMMFNEGNFSKYFKEASYNRQSITGDVFGWNLIQSEATSSCQATLQNLESAVATHNVNLNNYSNIVLISMCPGYARYGSSNTGPMPHLINGITYNKVMTWANVGIENWYRSSNQMSESMDGPHILNNLEHLLIHEFGHALGLLHAHGLSCEGTLPTNNCQGVGLGNYFDTMAYWTIGLHFNGWAKAKLGWFSETEIKTITQSGTYVINDLESLPSNTNLNEHIKIYRIKPSTSSTKTPIWIEFRKAIGYDRGLNTPAFGGFLGGGGEVPPHNMAENEQGILIYREGFENNLGGQINAKSPYLMYLRNAPNLGTSSNPYQVSLNPGQTYIEPRYGLSLTTLNSTSTTSRTFEVAMDQDFECERLAPEAKTTLIGNPVATPGTSKIFSVWTKNMDYLSCSNSNLNFSVDFGGLQENGSTSSVNPFLSNLSPDDERQFGFGVWVPAGTIPGTYNVGVTITNQTSGLYTSNTIPIVVQ